MWSMCVLVLMRCCLNANIAMQDELVHSGPVCQTGKVTFGAGGWIGPKGLAIGPVPERLVGIEFLVKIEIKDGRFLGG